MQDIKKIALLFLLIIQHNSYTFMYYQSIETLITIQKIIESKQKGALLRFGDGDLALAQGKNSGTHQCSPCLQKEMIEAFSINGPSIMKTLPLLCKEHGGNEVELFYIGAYLSEQACHSVISQAKKIWGGPINDIYSPIALVYTAVAIPALCIEFLKFIKQQQCELFIGNKDIPSHLINLLFGDCQVVATPARSAYNTIDRIEKECLSKISLQSDRYRLIIMSCGNTGRILIKRLWPKIENVFFFDIGSLMDALCGWKTREWIRNTNFNNISFINQFKNSTNF